MKFILANAVNKFLLSFVVLISLSAIANDKSRSIDSETRSKPSEPTDVDEIITNAKLRAETGSKSLWSMRTIFYYYAAALAKPFGAERPNITGYYREEPVSLTGDLAVKYRLTEKDNLVLGVGLELLRPFHESVDTLGQRGQFNDPYLEYSRLYRISELQMISKLMFWYVASKADRESGYDYNLNFNQNILGTVAGGKLTLGFIFDMSNYSFNGAAQAGQVDINVGGFPFLEYAINEKYSFRTVFRFLTYNHYRLTDEWKHSPYTQSTGLIISLSRDVVLYPYFQCAPENLRDDRTTLAVSLTMNLF